MGQDLAEQEIDGEERLQMKQINVARNIKV